LKYKSRGWPCPKGERGGRGGRLVPQTVVRRGKGGRVGALQGKKKGGPLGDGFSLPSERKGRRERKKTLHLFLFHPRRRPVRCKRGKGESQVSFPHSQKKKEKKKAPPN